MDLMERTEEFLGTDEVKKIKEEMIKKEMGVLFYRALRLAFRAGAKAGEEVTDEKTICWNCGKELWVDTEYCRSCELEQWCQGGCGGLVCEDARKAGRDTCFSCAVANA